MEREKKNGERGREREGPVLSSYCQLVGQGRGTPSTTGFTVLPPVASLLLALRLCPAVLWGRRFWFWLVFWSGGGGDQQLNFFCRLIGPVF